MDFPLPSILYKSSNSETESSSSPFLSNPSLIISFFRFSSGISIIGSSSKTGALVSGTVSATDPGTDSSTVSSSEVSSSGVSSSAVSSSDVSSPEASSDDSSGVSSSVSSIDSFDSASGSSTSSVSTLVRSVTC